MLEQIVTYLASKLAVTGKFASVNGLVDIVTEPRTDTGETKKFPAIYTGRDGLRFITSYDFKSGCIFFTRGRDTYTDGETKRACSMVTNATYRPNLYIIAGRESCGSMEAVMGSVSSAVNASNPKHLRQSTGAITIQSFVNAWQTEPEQVLRDVFDNVDVKNRHDLVFLKAELNISVSYFNNCINVFCQ